GGVLPHPQLTWRWLRGQRAFGARFATEWLTRYGAVQLVLSLVGFSARLSSLDQLRGAQIVFGPAQALLNGARLSLTSLAVRAQARNPERLRPFSTWISLGLGAIAVLWMAVALAIPDALGEALLGDTWNGARHLFV